VVLSDISEQPCSYHPKVLTRLRCSKCGKPICPRCAVETPVGFRCPECAQVRGLPTYETSPGILARSALAGLVAAGIVGVLWGYLPDWGFYMSLALGFGVAEAMAWAANYKRGRDLQFLAIGCVLVGIVLSRVVLAQRVPGLGLDELLDQAMYPRVIAAFRLRLIPDLLFMALSVVIPYVRFR